MEAVEQKGIFHRKIIRPLLGFLKQGVTPTKLSIALSLGFLIGVLPLPGMTTIICSIIALIFRLNMPAMQLVNQVLYPAQLILLLPFIRGGEYLLDSTPLKLNAEEIFELFKADFLKGIETVGSALGAGVVSWTVFSIPAYFLLYYVTYYFLNRYAQRKLR